MSLRDMGRHPAVSTARKVRSLRLASAPAYGSEVIASGDAFIPGTEVPGFYPEARCASLFFGFFRFKVVRGVHGTRGDCPTQAKCMSWY